MIFTMILQGAFGAMAVATQHDHWLKTDEQLEPIVGPLCRQVQTLPAKALKAFEKRAGWIMLAAGTTAVVGQDVVAEVKLRAIERAARNGQEGPQDARRGPSGPGGHPRYPNTPGAPPGGSQSVYGPGEGQPANGTGGNGAAWNDTLPSGALPVDYPLPN